MKVKMSEVFDLQIGKTPARNNPAYWGGKRKWVSVADIGNSGKYIYKTKEMITDLGVQESGIRKVPKGTVVMSFKLSIGKTAIVTEDMYTNEAIVAFIDKREYLIDPNYLYHVCNGINWTEKTNKAVMGLVLNKAILSDQYLMLPDLNRQCEIAKILDKIDMIIAIRQKQAEGLEYLIKARFVEMFGEPIANPRGWPVKSLKELSTLVTNGNTPKGGSENYVESGITFLRSQNVWRNRIELDDVVYIDEATHKSMKKSSLHNKDILITKTGRINTENSSLGRAALFLGKDDSANINGHVYLVRLTDDVIPEYVVTILTGEAYRKYIRKVCVGGIDKRQINIDQVEDFPIIMPPLHEQKRFAEFREQVDKSKAAVNRSLEKLEILKKSLMQRYFG